MQNLIFWSLMALLVACTKGEPTLENLASVAGPELDFSETTVMGLTQSITISGKCDVKFDRIQASVGGGGFQDVRDFSTSSSVSCASSKRFTFTFSMADPVISARLGFTYGVQSSRVVTIRGMTKIGPSDSVGFTISYSPALGGAEDRYITGISSGLIGSPGSTLASDVGGTVFMRAQMGLASQNGTPGSKGYLVDASLNTVSTFLMYYDPNGTTPDP